MYKYVGYISYKKNQHSRPFPPWLSILGIQLWSDKCRNETTVWDWLNSYRTSSLLTGWWLSMESKDSFLEKLQPLNDLPNVLDKRQRFARDYKDPAKTLGFILVRLSAYLYFSFVLHVIANKWNRKVNCIHSHRSKWNSHHILTLIMQIHFKFITTGYNVFSFWRRLQTFFLLKRKTLKK